LYVREGVPGPVWFLAPQKINNMLFFCFTMENLTDRDSPRF